ncbi:unnamed protein product [Sphacelaria rigidula]
MFAKSSRAVAAAARSVHRVSKSQSPVLSALQQRGATTTSRVPTPLPDAVPLTGTWNTAEQDSLVQDIRNEGDLQDLLSSTDAEGLVVVKFHATLCSSSKQIEAKYEETASEFSDMGAVHFAQVNYDNNAQLCQKMGIESLPHVQIFAGKKGKIADFSISDSKFDTLPSLLAERREAAAES